MVMRDPNRIDRFCDELKTIWHQVPDWRFGQLIVNLCLAYKNEHSNDPFYVEDEEFFDFAYKFISKAIS
jgi:hypothetical protein